MKATAKRPRTCRLFLEIGPDIYHVKPLPVQDPHCGVLKLVRLRRADGVAYECRVCRDGWSQCTCADWEFRHSDGQSDCKHLAALRAAGLLPAAFSPGHASTWPAWTDSDRWAAAEA